MHWSANTRRLIGAIAVTIPTCWFLWPSASHADSGHHGDHEEHAESHDEEGEHAEAEDEKPAEEAEPAEEPESKDEPAELAEPAESSDEPAKPSGSEGESQPATTDPNKASSKDEEAESKETPASGGDTDDAQFKGKMNSGSSGNDDTRKSEPDSKGGYKKRIDSGLANDLTGSDAGQQAGMSNTQTTHSTKPHEDPEKSKKGDGTTETAKQMGPVDPSAPVR